MKILLLTNHYYPETFRCNDIAVEMVKRGHDVMVMTAIPDYPKGKFFDGYGVFRKRHEIVDGVKIVRFAVIPRGKGGAVRMVLQYASSLFCSTIHALKHAICHKYDVIFIHNTSPATICLPVCLIRSLRRTPVVHWILDMWPENLVAGGIRSKRVFSLVDKMMKYIYKRNDAILISSLGFRSLLVERNVPNEKIEYLPNWSDDAITQGKTTSIQPLPKGFKVMFAGNMGNAQNLENVLKAAGELKDNHDIKWIFVGDGRKAEWVKNYVRENSLQETVILTGRQPIETMPSYFAQADIMLVSLNNEISFNLTLPAKVQAYMSCHKPIIAFANGESQEIISRADCGWSVDADDYQGLARKVKEVSVTASSILKTKGENGYKYCRENFDKTMLMDRIEATLNKVVKHN